MHALPAIRRSLWSGVKIALGASVITYTFRRTIADVVKLQGASMEPTLSSEDDVVLCERITPYSELGVGDIVVFNSPTHPGTLYCKRIVGLTGTPYSVATPTPFGLVTSERLIPQGHVWVEGDNKAKSVDSRVFGPIPTGLIEGRVCARVWPLSRAQLIEKRNEVFPPYPLLCLHPALAERVRLKGVPQKQNQGIEPFWPDPIFHFLAPETDAARPKLGDILSQHNRHPTDETERILDAVRELIESPRNTDKHFPISPLPFRVVLTPIPPKPEETKQGEIGSPNLVDSPPLFQNENTSLNSADTLEINLPLSASKESLSFEEGILKNLLTKAARRQEHRDEIRRHVTDLPQEDIDALISAVLDTDPQHDWSATMPSHAYVEGVDKIKPEDLFDPASSFSSGAMIKRAKGEGDSKTQ